jgi:hypothetical protein
VDIDPLLSSAAAGWQGLLFEQHSSGSPRLVDVPEYFSSKHPLRLERPGQIGSRHPVEIDFCFSYMSSCEAFSYRGFIVRFIAMSPVVPLWESLGITPAFFLKSFRQVAQK